MRISVSIIGLMLGLCWMACPDPGEGDPVAKRVGAGEACVANTDCEVGLLCHNGICMSPDSIDDDNSNGAMDSGNASNGNDVADSGSTAGNNNEGADAGEADNEPHNPFTSNGRPWLLSIDNGSNELLKIDAETGEHRGICPMAVSGFYVSTTFGINGVLYASKLEDDILEIIDPCTCEVQEVGPTNFGLLPGITANGVKEDTLFGLETQENLLLELDNETGAGSVIGDTIVDFSLSGTTWSDDLPGLFAINNIDDKLYTLDILTGEAHEVVQLDVDFHYVGIEWNAYNRKLYACTTVSSGLGQSATIDDGPGSHGTDGLAILYEINPETGRATRVNDLPHACNNLAAPWTAVPCVDDIVVVEEGSTDAGVE